MAGMLVKSLAVLQPGASTNAPKVAAEEESESVQRLRKEAEDARTAEALKALEELVGLSGVPASKHSLREAGAAKPLVELLRRGAKDVAAQWALTILQNIARGSAETRDEIFKAGGVPLLLGIVRTHPSIKRPQTDAAEAFLRPEGEEEEEEAEIAIEAAEVLSELMHQNGTNVAEVISRGGALLFMKLLHATKLRACKATSVALSALLNIAECVEATETLAQVGAVVAFLKVLEASSAKLYSSIAIEALSKLAQRSLTCRTIIAENAGLKKVLESLEWAAGKVFKPVEPVRRGSVKGSTKVRPNVRPLPRGAKDEPQPAAETSDERRFAFLAYKALLTLEAFALCETHWEELVVGGAVPVLVSILFKARNRRLQLAKTAANTLYQLHYVDATVGARKRAQAEAEAQAQAEAEAAAADAAAGTGDAIAAGAVAESDGAAVAINADTPSLVTGDEVLAEALAGDWESLERRQQAVLPSVAHSVVDKLIGLIYTEIIALENDEEDEQAERLGEFSRHLAQAMISSKLRPLLRDFILGELAIASSVDADEKRFRRAQTVSYILNDVPTNFLVQARERLEAAVRLKKIRRPVVSSGEPEKKIDVSRSYLQKAAQQKARPDEPMKVQRSKKTLR